MKTTNKILQLILSNQGEMLLVDIQKALDLDEEQLQNELENLQKLCEVLELNLLKSKNKVSIFSHKEVSDFYTEENIKNLQKPLSDSALQTLSVILYKNETTKAEIDFVRGVDSGKSLKTLYLRGLIEKSGRFYTTSHETLAYLGVSKATELPDQIEIQEKLSKLLNNE